MIRSLAKTAVVVVSSTVLVTLSANAIDMRGSFSSSFLANIFSTFSSRPTEVSVCPEHMVLVTQALTPFCMDMYEASASKECGYKNPEGESETVLNLATENCKAVSTPQNMPWRYITLAQAEQACSRSGKRLPTANEWYKGALGTPDIEIGLDDEQCNVANNRADGVAKTGGGMRCVSDAGAYDMVGNVWEWVAETVEHGEWNGRVLPVGGFVANVDVDGIAFETKSSQESMFNGDRFWLDNTITAGMMRGGYFNSRGQAGVYATYLASPPTFSGDAVGFRCVTSVLE